MSQPFKRGRKKEGRVPYTINNLLTHLYGVEVTQFAGWQALAAAIGCPAYPKQDESRRAEFIVKILSEVRDALYLGDGEYLARLGKAAGAMPKDEHGNDPLLMALMEAQMMIYFGSVPAKGLKMTRQDVVKLALTFLPPRNYEATRVALFKKIKKIMPQLPSARSQLKEKATKRGMRKSR